MIRPALILLGLFLTSFCAATWAQLHTSTESPPPAAENMRTTDLVVVRVSGQPITESQVLEAIEELARERQMSFDQLRQRNALLFDEAVNSLTMIAVLKNHARRQNLPVDKTLVDRQIKLLAERYPTPEAFQKALNDQGLTESELRLSLEESFSMQQLINMIS
ncbi:MAG TPA: SurA N-terminal domain-containing protein, partial [Acidobacteriota bacterium]|nr:SurA N-terminal domain-containing protein [Acidobacteriota bacterium]